MLLKGHFWFGVKNGGALYAVSLPIVAYFGLFSEMGLPMSFLAIMCGVIAVVLGSLLPDMDAPRSPIHDGMFAFFSILVGSLIIFGGLKIHPYLFVLLPIGPALIVYVDRKYLPGHRGIIHTPEAGAVEGGILAITLIIITGNGVFGLWVGFWLAVGHSIHLLADKITPLRIKNPYQISPNKIEHLMREVD